LANFYDRFAVTMVCAVGSVGHNMRCDLLARRDVAHDRTRASKNLVIWMRG
jgi:hypothetical protein